MGKFSKICGYCQSEFKGRVDSLFCSTSCRTSHWKKNKEALSSFKYQNLLSKDITKKVRKFYVATSSAKTSNNISKAILSCIDCREKGLLGFFYTNYTQDYIRCDQCGITFRRDLSNKK